MEERLNMDNEPTIGEEILERIDALIALLKGEKHE